MSTFALILAGLGVLEAGLLLFTWAVCRAAAQRPPHAEHCECHHCNA